MSNVLKQFDINEKGRDFAVGDIHGKFNLFKQALNKINFDENVDRIFSVGDLVDRGEDSLKCLQLIKEPWFHAVIGNHEDMMMRATNFAIRDWINLWVSNGGEWGFKDGIFTLDKHKNLTKRVDNLPLAISVRTKNNGTIGICHAQPPTNEKGELDFSEFETMNSDKFDDSFLWGREVIYGKVKQDRCKGVDFSIHGHTPVKNPLKRGNMIFIDTGAFATDNLFLLDLNSNFDTILDVS